MGLYTRNLGARWAPISSWWPSATLLALRACLTSSFTPFGHSSRVTHADDKFTSVLEQVRFQERGEQCHFGSFWAILGHFGSFWVILGLFGSFWIILGHFGPFWVILGHFGSFWTILGHLVEFWLQKHHLHCIVKFKKNAPNLDFLSRE